jgi:hypothetical protein
MQCTRKQLQKSRELLPDAFHSLAGEDQRGSATNAKGLVEQIACINNNNNEQRDPAEAKTLPRVLFVRLQFGTTSRGENPDPSKAVTAISSKPGAKGKGADLESIELKKNSFAMLR